MDVVGTLTLLGGLTVRISVLLEGHFINHLKAKLVRAVRKKIAHRGPGTGRLTYKFAIVAASSAHQLW